MKQTRIWPVLLAAMIGIAILCGLGVWQVQRLQWKQDLLARLAARAAAEPIGVGAAAAELQRGQDIEFLKVRFQGNYGAGAGLAMMSTFEGGPGWTIVTPVLTADGKAVLVDRGQVPPDRLRDYPTPEGAVDLTGVIRRYPNGRARFDPDNDPVKGQWFWWDIPAMLRQAKLPQGVEPLPFVVQLLPDTAAADLPRPPEPRANLRNNHLGYAITWFGLALALLAVTAVYVRGRTKKSTA